MACCPMFFRVFVRLAVFFAKKSPPVKQNMAFTVPVPTWSLSLRWDPVVLPLPVASPAIAQPFLEVFRTVGHLIRAASSCSRASCSLAAMLRHAEIESFLENWRPLLDFICLSLLLGLFWVRLTVPNRITMLSNYHHHDPSDSHTVKMYQQRIKGPDNPTCEVLRRPAWYAFGKRWVVWDEWCELVVWDEGCGIEWCEMSGVRWVVWDELCVRWVVCEMSGVRWVVWDGWCEMSCVSCKWDEWCEMRGVRWVVWISGAGWVVWDELCEMSGVN